MSQPTHIPHGADRLAVPGELCTCGRPAVVMYLSTPTGLPVGYCGRRDAAPIPPEVEATDEAVTAAAIESLKLLHPSDRYVATSMLALWAHRARLTESRAGVRAQLLRRGRGDRVYQLLDGWKIRNEFLLHVEITPSQEVPNFDEYSDARYRVDYGETRPGDEAIVERYERLILNPAHQRYTEAVERRREQERDL